MAIDDNVGKVGVKQGPLVETHWRWYYSVPSLPVWALLGLLLVVPSANRRPQAWWILVLPAVVAGLGGLLSLTVADDGLDTLLYFLTVQSIGWASVWLLAPWLAVGNRLVRALLMWLVMFAVGVAGYVGYYQFTWSGDVTLNWAVFWGITTVTLVGTMTTSGACWKGGRPMYVFMLWLVMWMPIIGLVCMIGFGVIVATMIAGPDFAEVLCPMAVGAFVLSGCLYVLNAPVMVLARFCPFYRERFELLFGPLERAAEEWPPADTPLVPAATVMPGDGTEGESPFAEPDTA